MSDWLTDRDKAALTEAVRITKAQPVEHVNRWTCGVCDGRGCDSCRWCQCPRCDPYVPEYVRRSIQNWRPTHAVD